MPSRRIDTVVRRLEWPVALLTLLVIPALVLEERADSPQLQLAAVVVNWVVWIAYCADFTVRWIADGRPDFPRRAWFDVLLIVLTPPFAAPASLQATRSLRVLRLLRLVRGFAMSGMAIRLAQRHFGRRRFHHVGGVAAITVLLGAVGILTVETGHNAAIGGFGDALWWAVVTATTVGYGDVSPVTVEGRVIAVLLMVTGIGVIGVFTATVASFFFEDQQAAATDLSEVVERLEAIERRLEALAPRLREGETDGGKA